MEQQSRPISTSFLTPRVAVFHLVSDGFRVVFSATAIGDRQSLDLVTSQSAQNFTHPKEIMNIEEAAIHMSIFQTMGVYHTALDDADFADLATVFTENAEMEVLSLIHI